VGDEVANIKFRFYPPIQQWCFDLAFRGQTVKGVKICLGVLHINSYSFPFDFVAIDTSNLGLDPFQLNDFESGRINFYMLTAEEMAAYRGYDVEV
jgi:hypothetical protein